jgi:SIR2-like domain
MITGTFASRTVKLDRTPRLDNIIKELISGEATPFVGAGVSANNLNGSDDYSQVISLVEREITHIMAVLATSDRFEPHKNLETFVQVFRDNYVIGRKCNDVNRGGKEQDQKDKDQKSSSALKKEFKWFQHEKVRQLRADLAQLIVHLTRKYNEKLSERNQYYFSNFNPVDYVDERFGGSDRHNFPAAKSMASLRELRNEISRAYSTDNKNTQLEVASRLFDGAFRSLSLRYDPNTGERRGSKLHVDHLIWLTDLLWLTFAIWLPLHPTSRELAAELSFVSDQKTRSSERRLVRAAECFSDPNALAEYISKRFQKNQHSSFKEALVMDSHWALASTALIKPAEHVRSAKMLFTTNFDRGIEDALESLIKAAAKTKSSEGELAKNYRLVFPVLVENNQSVLNMSTKKDDPYFDLCWAVSDWCHKGNDNVTSKVRWVLDRNTDRYNSPRVGLENDAREVERLRDLFIEPELVMSEEFDGPIIIKFHGAPLEKLGPSLHCSDLPRDPELRHYLVVSEHQYIDTIIRSGETSPSWLMKVLTERDIAFLGYSIEDWNVRLHLAKQPSRSNRVRTGPHAGDNGEVATPLSRSAIVRGATDAERTLFERLGIGLASSDLGLLIRDIKDNSVFRSSVANSVFNKSNRNYLDALTKSG